MIKTARTAILQYVLILAFAASMARLATAQQITNPPDTQGAAPATKSTTEVLKAMDQLIEQNRQLEKQNRELMDQIIALRQALGGQPAAPALEENAPGAQAEKAPTGGTSSTQPASSQPQKASSQSQAASTQAGKDNEDTVPEIWGEWNPGRGFQVAKTERGVLNLSGYLVARYLNQLPAEQTAVDHLGHPIPVQARQDFQLHRVMLFASGWFLNPKFKYYTFVWTVNDTTQVAVGGALLYDFNKHFSLGLGFNPLPINRSIQGNHPYWPTYDRAMADEFFRPFFTQGLFGEGELGHRVWYKWITGNNLSTLAVRATQLTRELNFGGSLTWMPTTGEFGPRGGFGDFEDHQKLATRFGIGYGVSRENRQSNENDPTNNTTIRLADSLNIFDTGALANGVTVTKTTWHLLAADVGFKKRGLWIGAEGYYRLLDNFDATGPLPVGSIRDTGFYVQGTYMLVPKLVEIYTGTSYVFSNFGKPKEFFYGGNWYPAHNRNWRLNLHIISIDRSPVNSTFGFYMGQLRGTIVAAGVTALY